jgi:hypothetical protein
MIWSTKYEGSQPPKVRYQEYQARHDITSQYMHNKPQTFELSVHDLIHFKSSSNCGISCHALKWPSSFHPHLSSSLTNPLFLARRLIRMLRKRVLWVAAQSALGVIALLLRAALDIATLVVDVAAGLSRLGLGLPLGLGGLAAGVGCGHCDVLWWL